MNITNIFKHLAERNKERRRQEMEQTARYLVGTELDSETGTLYVCVAGVRIRMITGEKADGGILSLPFTQMGEYVTAIRNEYLKQHGYGEQR